MKLKNYIYANEYIANRQYLFFEIKKKCRSNSQFTVAADLFIDKVGLQKRVNLVPVTEIVRKMVDEVTDKCPELLLVEEKEGIIIAIYYHFFNLKMVDIAEILSMSTRTCWRHLNIAIKQLNIVLQLLSECA